MSDSVKYPEITVNLSDVDGNAFSIMGAVRKALRRGGVPREEIEQYLAESTSGDYSNLLMTTTRWVSVS
jgi:hypothetical protein